MALLIFLLPSFTISQNGEIELTGFSQPMLKLRTFGFVPLGIRFDNAPVGGTITITNMFISRGNSAPNFKGGFKLLLNKMRNLWKIHLSMLMLTKVLLHNKFSNMMLQCQVDFQRY